MNLQAYRQRLLDLERHLSIRAAGDTLRGRDQKVDSAGDVADASVADENASTDFTVAELDASVLQQVQDALRRIDDGTYGRCLADGEPIDEKRLDAVPWAPYCARHQALQEAARGGER